MPKLSFDGQRSNETFKFLFRRHFITTFRGFLACIILTALGLIPILLWPDVQYIFWVWFACFVLGILAFGYTITLWYYSVFIVTNQRLRQISQKSLFRRNIVDLSLDKIEAAAVQTPGFWASLIGFGTIVLQTNIGDLTISMVKNPEKVYNKLQNIIGTL